MSIYSNFPVRANEVWVMGHPDKSNKGWKFLFRAKIGELDYFGEKAWNPTMFERAIKQKCREIKKRGEYKSFEFCDEYCMYRYMANGRSNFYSNWPFEDFAQVRR